MSSGDADPMVKFPVALSPSLFTLTLIVIFCGPLLGKLLAGLVFGVSATDPLTLVAVGGLLALVTVVASWIPARRAMRVDPAVVLRAE